MIENTENLRRSTFRKMVGVIGLSLVYDLVWFGLNDQLDDSDGGMAAGVRKFSLWVSYFSFFFRVSVCNNLSLDRGVSGALEGLCLICEHYQDENRNEERCAAKWDQLARIRRAPS